MPRNEIELDQFLRSTLEDFRLSRAERRALVDLLGEECSDASTRALWRGRAFAIVRDLPPESRALDWLEEVVRAMDAASARQTAPATDGVSHARFSPGDSCWREIVHRFDQASTAIEICVFTITDDRITNAILAAHQRRVEIRLLTDDLKAGDLGSDIGRLAEAGIAVRTDRRPSHMHHKFAIFDRIYLLNGSYNWTRGAALENSENLITTSEPGLVLAFSQEFERNWKSLG